MGSPDPDLIGILSDTERLKLIGVGEERATTLFCGESYRGYPCFEYTLPEGYDADCVSEICALQIIACKDAIAVSTEGHGVLTVYPPGAKASTAKFVLKGGFGLVRRSGFKILSRLTSYENYCEDMMKRHIDKNTWYIANLAVDPPYQNKGLAKRMLNPFLNYFDETGSSAYLETHSGSNVPFYEHFGFELVETGKLPGTDVTHYAMLRMPKS